MGFVWNIILSFDNEEFWEEGEDEPREICEPLERINASLPYGNLVSLVGPTYGDDAGHGMDANLYGGGFKHFDIDRFIATVESQSWKSRENVQLWVRGAEEGMAEGPFNLVELGTPIAPAPHAPAKARRRSRKSKVASAKKKKEPAAKPPAEPDGRRSRR
jgi:hypothetical protein